MISGHGHNPPFDESVSLCLHFLGTSPTKAFRACAQLRVCVCVHLCAGLAAPRSRGLVRTSHETRGELAAWGRSSRMSAVSRHKGGHFHFLVCHLPLPHGLLWVCLLSPRVYVEAASLLCLPPGDSGKLPAASLSPVVPVRAGKGLSSLGTCLFFATAAEPSQPSVSWPPDGLAPGPQAAWRWSRSTEDETAPARLHLPQPPPAGPGADPVTAWLVFGHVTSVWSSGPTWGRVGASTLRGGISLGLCGQRPGGHSSSLLSGPLPLTRRTSVLRCS